MMNARKLRLESLEERTLLAVTAGGVESAVPAAMPTEAAMWVVNTLDDPASWRTNDDVVSLREAISRAARGDTITFDESLTGQTIVLNGNQLSVSRGMTIDASSIGGITIDANGESRVFYISGGTEASPVELIGLTITGGYFFSPSARGGGIYSASGTLTITDSTISGNSAISSSSSSSAWGGGIYIGSGTLTISNSAISENTAFSASAAVYGGGIYNERGTLTISNSAISGNTVFSASAAVYGGGVYNERGTLTISDSTVSGNTATSYDERYSYGGGFYNGTGTLTMTGCTVSGNTADYGGGMSGSARGIVRLYNAVVALNTSSRSENDVYPNSGSLYAYNTLSTFTDWTESEDCAVYDASKPLFTDAENGDYTLAYGSQAINAGNNSYVTAETDLAGNPRIVGGVVDLGAYEFQPTVTTLEDVVDDQDGFISLREAVTLYSGAGVRITFAENLAGGTITLAGSEIAIDEGIIIDASGIGGMTVSGNGNSRVFNVSGGTEERPVELIGLVITDGTEEYGGGIYCTGNLSITDCAVTNNNADYGGGIYHGSGILTAINCEISRNRADASGGGVENDAEGTAFLAGCTIVGNSANQGGGVSSFGDVEFYNTIIVLNTSESASDDVYAGSGSLDAYHTLSSYTEWTDSDGSIAYDPSRQLFADFSGGDYTLANGSQAVDAGENVYVVTETDLAGNARIMNGVVDMGAYEYPVETRSTVVTTLLDVVDPYDELISLREAAEYYANEGDTVTFAPELAGGTIVLGGSEIRIGRSIAVDASEIGGMTVDADGKSRVFYVSGGDESNPVELIGLTVTGGSASSDQGGGGIYNSGILRVTNSTISGNTASSSENFTDANGGGICNEVDAMLTLTNCTVSGNTCFSDAVYSSSWGGGISNFGIMRMTNSTVSGNTASSSSASARGGGISNWGILEIVTSVISENTVSSSGLTSGADGGGIYNWGTLLATDTLISGNTASYDELYSYGGGVYSGYDGTTTLSGCTVSGNTADYGGGICGYIDGLVDLYNTIVAQNTAILSDNDVYRNSGVFYAHNCLSTFTDWKESKNCLVYDESLPLFTDAAAGDYTLAKYSQAIDVGNNAFVETETDLAGNPRVAGVAVDLGAFERAEEAFDAPAILTGNVGVYVSYGANRHFVQWEAVPLASTYELAYSTDGESWTTVQTAETSAVITGLTYGEIVAYRVRVLGHGSYTDSDWSPSRSFYVCPVDVNNDGDISGVDRTIMASSWLTEEGDDDYRYCADIDGDGGVSGVDLIYLSANWGSEVGVDEIVYPNPRAAADAVFADYRAGDLDVDLDAF